LKATEKTWPWKLLLAVILIGVAAGTWGAIQKIDYQWRWNRVPQYFAYVNEEAKKIPFDGKVVALVSQGKEVKVTLAAGKAEKTELIVAADSLKVKEGDELFAGDTVGFEKLHHSLAGAPLCGVYSRDAASGTDLYRLFFPRYRF